MVTLNRVRGGQRRVVFTIRRGGPRHYAFRLTTHLTLGRKREVDHGHSDGRHLKRRNLSMQLSAIPDANLDVGIAREGGRTNAKVK